MFRMRRYAALAGICILAAVGSFMLAGCQSDDRSGATTQPAIEARGGAQLWSENCARCHNLHSPSHYSAVQWEVTVHAMRVRAGLTGHQQRAITEFLQSASAQ